MDFLNDIFKNYLNKNISGFTDELKTNYINYLYNNTNKNIIVLTSSLYEATKFYNYLYTYNSNVYLFPMDDFLTSVALAISPDLKLKRLETLQNIKTNDHLIIVSNLMGFLRFVPKKSELTNLEVNIKKDDIINRNKLIEILNKLGYSKTSIVTTTGEYSVRGFVMDIYPYNYDNPIRLEFFGNSIERIKSFMVDTQLSFNELPKIEILPYREVVLSKGNTLFDIMNNPLLITINNTMIKQNNIELEEQIINYKKSKSIDAGKIFMASYEKYISKINVDLSDFNRENYINVKCQTLEHFNNDFPLLKKFITNYNNYNIKIFVNNEKLMKYLKTDLLKNVNNINYYSNKINKGFIIENNLVISENDINISNEKQKYHNLVKIGKKIKDYNEIQTGDYVVHSIHGIGIYGGVKTLTKNRIEKDYILINYANNDKVYIPVEKINTIYKYSDAEGKTPKISSLNSTTWAKTKFQVKNKIHDISKELLRLYAIRSNVKTSRYKETPEEMIFANEFEYTETRDQIVCINDVLTDLTKEIPMDRLLCGDVGFGKTEVAFRAIFRTVMNEYQAVYLCPTTILSKQQYNSALLRFKNFPINIALLNRFTTQKQFKEITEKLKNGKIDVLFGTHKLFNSEIEYYKLGLLVVDEEQRFGVSQKEKIKEIAKNINVLTLSATPIPRTLKMAMSGLKDLSILDTPPQDRFPVQTYVIEENEILIKEAIYKELSRHGQVYYLFNNVQKIEDEANKIKRLIPDARICYAHGQMSKDELETIIESFVNYEYDILLCTTIIETGIDISNVNTLIIINAENYGLSQLYQLRGRVGRSNKIAYAYLTYKPNKLLNETAMKRLNAIKEFTELGSGYKIAMRDLSIRGAGDLLGSEQAGFIDSVGIDLYTKMVEESINDLKGIKNEEADSTTESLLNVDTHIDETYAGSESVRIEIHEMINEIKDTNSLIQVKSEIEDRFGIVDGKMEIYMYEELFEKLAAKLKIKNIIESENSIELTIPVETSNRIDGEKLFLETYNINPKFRIGYRAKQITISLPINNQPKHYIYYLTDLLTKILHDLC